MKWGFWHIFESTLILRLTLKRLTSLKLTWNQGRFQSAVLEHFEVNLDFKRPLKFFIVWPVKKIHILLMSHLWAPKCPWANVWISSSWMIHLSSFSERANFFWLSHCRLHACGFLSHMFSWNGRTTGSSSIIYFLMMCLYLFLWQDSVNLIDGLSINRGKLTIGSYVSVRSSRYEARGKFGEHERCVRVA